MPELVEVLVRGKLLSGWKSVQLTMALDALCTAFEIVSPVRSPYPIAPDDPIEIYASGDLMLRGHVEAIERSIGERAARVKLSGRDNTADLIDCSAQSSTGEWKNVTLSALVRALCDPYEIGVEDMTRKLDPFEIFHLRPGDTAFSAIDRACRLRGVLAYSDSASSLILREPGLDRADCDLVEGENLSSGEFVVDMSQRFYSYQVLGQQPGIQNNFAGAALVKGEAKDLGVRTKRSLIVIAESVVNNQTATERAQWEAINRAANAEHLDVTIPGWRQRGDGGRPRPWAINELVNCLVPSIDIQRDLLMRRISFQQDDGAESTEAQLVRADAFTMKPDVDPEDDMAAGWLKGTTEGESDPDDALDDIEAEEGQ